MNKKIMNRSRLSHTPVETVDSSTDPIRGGTMRFNIVSPIINGTEGIRS
jgi:hypothetical protein